MAAVTAEGPVPECRNTGGAGPHTGWPIWPIVGWGIGLVRHAWKTFGERPISESDIEAEMRRNRGEPSA